MPPKKLTPAPPSSTKTSESVYLKRAPPALFINKNASVVPKRASPVPLTKKTEYVDPKRASPALLTKKNETANRIASPSSKKTASLDLQPTSPLTMKKAVVTNLEGASSLVPRPLVPVVAVAPGQNVEARGGGENDDERIVKRQRVTSRSPQKRAPSARASHIKAFGNLDRIGSDVVCAVFRCLDWPSHIVLTRVCKALRLLAARDAARPCLIRVPATETTRAMSHSAYARALAKLMPAKNLVSELHLFSAGARYVLRNPELHTHLQHLSISVAPACNMCPGAFASFVSLQSLRVVATNWQWRGWHAALEALPKTVTHVDLRDSLQVSANSRSCANKAWRTLPSGVTTLRIGVDQYGHPALCNCVHSSEHSAFLGAAAAAAATETLKRQELGDGSADGAVPELGLRRYESGHRAGLSEWKHLLSPHSRLRALRLGDLDLTLNLASEWWTARLRWAERAGDHDLANAFECPLDNTVDGDENKAVGGGGVAGGVAGGGGGGGGQDAKTIGNVSIPRLTDFAATFGAPIVPLAPYGTLRVLVAPLHSVFTFWTLLTSLPNLHTALLRHSRLVKTRLDVSDDDVGNDDADSEEQFDGKRRDKLLLPPSAVRHTNLRTLDLSFSILDPDLTVLRACDLPKLRILDLTCTPLAPDALHVLERFRDLRLLSLHQTMRAASNDLLDESSDCAAPAETDATERRTTLDEKATLGQETKETQEMQAVTMKAQAGKRGDDAKEEVRCPLPALAHLRYLDVYHAECDGIMTRDGAHWSTIYPALEHLRPSDVAFEVLQRLTTLTSLDMTRDRTEPLPSMHDLVAHLPNLRTLVLPARLTTRTVIPLYGRATLRARTTASQMRLEADIDPAHLLTIRVATPENNVAAESRERLRREAEEAETSVFEGPDFSEDACRPWSALERRARDSGVGL